MNLARILTAAVLAAALNASLTAPVRAGITEAGDEVNARIARIKTERGGGKNPNEKLIDARRGSRETDLLGDGCNIALGNIFEPAAGFATSARQQTTVVVQGDVIMANNRCK